MIEKKNLKKAIVFIVGAIASALAIAFGLPSCTVTRVVSTDSSYVQRGDTSRTITVKTVETYTAKKQSNTL